MKTSPKPYGVAIEPPLLKRAKAEAKRRRQSFSAYVCTLLDADLKAKKEAKE